MRGSHKYREGCSKNQFHFCDVLEIWVGDINGPPLPEFVVSIGEISRIDNLWIFMEHSTSMIVLFVEHLCPYSIL